MGELLRCGTMGDVCVEWELYGFVRLCSDAFRIVRENEGMVA